MMAQAMGIGSQRGNPYLTPALFGAGGDVAAAIIDLLSNYDPYKAEREFGIRSLRSSIGKPVLNVPQLINQNRMAIRPELNRVASATGQRLGLDSGIAAGEIFRKLLELEGGFGLQAGARNSELMANRDLRAAGMLMGL